MKTDLQYLKEAIDLSRQCTPCMTAYCVGAIIVTRDGGEFGGYTHQTDRSNHAEEEAIKSALDAGASLVGATIYCSMEPCSTRKSKPVSCSQLIIDHRFSKVVFAYSEPDHFVRCEGADILRNAGIEVLQYDELSQEVRRINSHILG